MKTITIHQPFAWLIVNGLKRVENRTWFTNYRGPLLIHAGSKRAYVSRAEWGDLKRHCPDLPAMNRLAFSAVVGRVELIDCRALEFLTAKQQADPFAVGPWCWLLGKPKAFKEPYQYRGSLGLWDFPDDLLD